MIKRLKKILLPGFIIFAIFYTTLYAFTALRGKALIVKLLEDLTFRKVDIGFYDLVPPFNLEIRNLSIYGLLNAERVIISPSMFSLLIGRLALNKVRIIRPEITILRTPPVAIETKSEHTAGPVTAKPAQKAKRTFPLRLVIKKLAVEGGKLNYVDHTPLPQGIRIAVKDLDFKLTNFYTFPSSAVTYFWLRGKIPWQMGEKEGAVNLDGWANLAKKDLAASLEVKGINGIYLYPYYAKWINLEGTHIEKALLNFTSDIHGLKNNVTAECHLELAEIVFKKSSPEESEEKAHEMVADIFKTSDQGKIVLDFTIRTKMDRPEFSFWNIKSAVDERFVEAKRKPTPADFLLLPLKIVEGVVRGTTEVSKAVINGTFAVGKEVKRGIFGKSKKKKE